MNIYFSKNNSILNNTENYEFKEYILLTSMGGGAEEWVGYLTSYNGQKGGDVTLLFSNGQKGETPGILE